jgi:peptide/nickel transport system substrate-binding protein
VKLRPLEWAAFFKGYSEKKYRGLIQSATAAFGNAATRLEAFVASGGAYVYGSYADIDGLFREQATEFDPAWGQGWKSRDSDSSPATRSPLPTRT